MADFKKSNICMPLPLRSTNKSGPGLYSAKNGNDKDSESLNSSVFRASPNSQHEYLPCVIYEPKLNRDTGQFTNLQETHGRFLPAQKCSLYSDSSRKAEKTNERSKKMSVQSIDRRMKNTHKESNQKSILLIDFATKVGEKRKKVIKKIAENTKHFIQRKHSQQSDFKLRSESKSSFLNEYDEFSGSTELTEFQKDSGYNPYEAAQPIRAFDQLRPFLKTVFNLDFNTLADFALDFDELSIASAIISKKFGINFPIKFVYNMEHFRSLYGIKPSKRPEESYKFVFKHAFKHLKREFLMKKYEHTIIGHNDQTLNFYNYYFGEISQKLNIEISKFFLPLTPDSYCSRRKDGVSQTINITYITLVCQSRVFLENFMQYVNHSFLEDYRDMISHKVKNLCDKWEQMFLQSYPNEKLVNFICDYIHTNKKCKLPWTLSEVEFAIDITNKFVSKCRKKNSSNSKFKQAF